MLDNSFFEAPYRFSNLCNMAPGSIIHGIAVDPQFPHKLEVSNHWRVFDPKTKKPIKSGDEFTMPCLLESRVNIVSRLRTFPRYQLKNNNVIYCINDENLRWFKEATLHANAFVKYPIQVGKIVGMYLGIQLRLNHSTALYILLLDGTAVWI